MFLTEAVFKKSDRLFNKGMYSIIVNPVKQDYSKLILKKDTDVIHNYLIINTKTKAIEFAVDQLPSAYEILQKLDEELRKTDPKPALKLVKETIQ